MESEEGKSVYGESGLPVRRHMQRVVAVGASYSRIRDPKVEVEYRIGTTRMND